MLFTSSKKIRETHKYLPKIVESKKGKVTHCFDVRGAMMGKTADKSDLNQQIEEFDYLK